MASQAKRTLKLRESKVRSILSTHQKSRESLKRLIFMFEFLDKNVLPAVTFERAEDAVKTAEALIKGGMKLMEIPFRTPEAGKAVEAIRKNIPEMVIGAGTLLTADQIKEAADAGAQFGLAPGLNQAVVEAAKSVGMPFIPGVMTPSEVELALALGCNVQKLFPAAQIGGIAMLKALAGPYGHTGVSFLPMGGVNQSNLSEFLAMKNVIAVGGSWVASKDLIKAGDFAQITENARKAVEG